MRLDRAARSIFLWEFVEGFVLAMRYFFRPKATNPTLRISRRITPSLNSKSSRCSAVSLGAIEISRC